MLQSGQYSLGSELGALQFPTKTFQESKPCYIFCFLNFNELEILLHSQY